MPFDPASAERMPAFVRVTRAERATWPPLPNQNKGRASHKRTLRVSPKQTGSLETTEPKTARFYPLLHGPDRAPIGRFGRTFMTESVGL